MNRNNPSNNQGDAQINPSNGWWVGLIAFFLGFYLLHLFGTEPDSQFPSGRFPACCFCYILIVVGMSLLYGYAIYRKWLAADQRFNTLLVAVCMSFFEAILLAGMVKSGDASVYITIGPLGFRTGDTAGRLVMLPVVIIFGIFALLPWSMVFRHSIQRRKEPKRTAPPKSLKSDPLSPP